MKKTSNRKTDYANEHGKKDGRQAPTSRATGKAAGFLTNHFELPAIGIAVVLSMISLVEFNHNSKWVILLCCAGSFVLTLFSIRKKRFQNRSNLITLAVGLYYLIVAVSVCWTCSGKFFLREYSKLLFVLPVFICIAFLWPKDKRAVRNLLLIICSLSTVYAILGVDLASAGLTKPLIGKVPGINLDSFRNLYVFRLSGVFANANISGGVHALAILLTLALFFVDSSRRERAWTACMCSIQMFTFASGLNRSAIAFFCLAVLLMIIVIGRDRLLLIFHVFCSLLPSALMAFAASNYYMTDGAARFLPLLFLACAGILSAVLEYAFVGFAEKIAQKSEKLSLILLLSLAFCGAAFACLSVAISGPLRIEEVGYVRRASYPKPGSYRLQIEMDGDADVTVSSQNAEQIAADDKTTLYRGSASECSFEVPEDSSIVSFRFTSKKGATILRASLEGTNKSYKLHMGYPLLPEALSGRLVGIWKDQNLVERNQFFRDGLKIARDYPVFGAGLGAFESLIAGYQEFRYVTRYVHNHYIQVLVDNGVVGLASYLFILVSCFICILRGRKEDDPYHELFAPMMGAFVMLVLHCFMDVIMSTTAYLPFAYAFFGICALCWGKPLSKKWLAAAGQIGFGAVSLTYAVLISLNIRANSIAVKSSSNPVRFFNSLESAIKMDAFDYVDWKVSYLTASAQVQAPEYKDKADRYAAELLDVPSNSLHVYLVNYYLSYQDYDMALQAAQNGAHFNYADADTWNHYFGDFQNAAAAHPEDTEEIQRITLALSDSFDMETARMFYPISLSGETLAWIETAEGDTLE